jgi:tetratricopeptide (TPR) repeat protein
VPEDATLEADLELVSWRSVEDVTPDGGVVKKTLTEGSEWKKPNQGASVKAHVVGRLLDGAVFEDADLDFVTDEEQVPEGLDLAVQKMKRGEAAEVTLAPRYAFGAEGAQRSSGAVPPDASVTYTVELKEFENAKEPWSMSDEEKLEAAQRRKEKGNAQFKAGKWAAALAKYKSASDLADQAGKDKEGLKAEARDVRKSALLNQAACHLKLGANRDAISAADKVLEKDGSNVKALYRRAQAYLALADYVECETDIKRALAEDPKNVGVRLLQKEYKQKSAESRQKDKALFSRMFKPSKDAPATPVASIADVDMGAEKAEAATAAVQGPGAAEPMETEASAAGPSAANGQTA